MIHTTSRFARASMRNRTNKSPLKYVYDSRSITEHHKHGKQNNRDERKLGVTHEITNALLQDGWYRITILVVYVITAELASSRPCSAGGFEGPYLAMSRTDSTSCISRRRVFHILTWQIVKQKLYLVYCTNWVLLYMVWDGMMGLMASRRNGLTAGKSYKMRQGWCQNGQLLRHARTLPAWNTELLSASIHRADCTF